MKLASHASAVLVITLLSACAMPLRGTGDLGVVIERANGSLAIVETTTRTRLGQVNGLGDLSHASVVYSRDGRYAFVFGRDGGLSRVDVLRQRIDKRIIQSGNSIGGAISQDGRLVAVSNYTPGGVRVFRSDTLEPVADIPASYGNNGKSSKVVGLADVPGGGFVFSLFDAGEIWLLNFDGQYNPMLTKFKHVGQQPYDALITPDGRYYIAGLFGEDGMAMLDLWYPDKGVRRILHDYGRGDKKLPVYKMPHLEGWAMAGDYIFVPAIGHHQVLVIDRQSWKVVRRIDVQGQPVFVMARPDSRQVWVNFAHPDNSVVQIIDVASMALIKTLTPGKAVLHMEFTPRGEHVWVSVRDDDKVVVYDTASFRQLALVPVAKPSGIFFSSRAGKIGL
ncbi:MAG: protein nirF [Gammaproteobacteria bacterium]|nr:protein nirF [Gammaproteobacteria bacterium]